MTVSLSSVMLVLELPERVDEQDRVVPRILPAAIASASSLELNKLPGRRVRVWGQEKVPAFGIKDSVVLG